eukprot:CAMPEP_0168613014 /NCGR_PEP_ID=MMETSP0449_2-20121227/3222_1 /TAXON_ID=1082188 /ORGANISM="Strombidium rassoulzadegani, Strain ras09" /LENGTH=149 /DNA_ID=CAMNT_0008653613 /DNA_START=19 /DNA_END=468 /DNA_ORIENTATION=-
MMLYLAEQPAAPFVGAPDAPWVGAPDAPWVGAPKPAIIKSKVPRPTLPKGDINIDFSKFFMNLNSEVIKFEDVKPGKVFLGSCYRTSYDKIRMGANSTWGFGSKCDNDDKLKIFKAMLKGTTDKQMRAKIQLEIDYLNGDEIMDFMLLI